MGGEMFPDRQARIGRVFGEWRDVGGGRRRRIVEDHIHDPNTAGDGMGPLRAGCHARHGGVGDDSTEARVIARDAAELAGSQVSAERFVVGRAVGFGGRGGLNALVPRAEELTLIVRRRGDQFRQGPLLDEHRVEEDKRLEHHLEACRCARHEVEVAG